MTAWFIKAAERAQADHVPIGFVATNSITQGEQVGQLWRILFDRFDQRIIFAHHTFAWRSEARSKANVHVVILGLEPASLPNRNAKLYLYGDIKGDPVEMAATEISPYLFDTGGKSDHRLVVHKEGRSINGWRPLIIGSQPIDDGHYIITADEYNALRERGDAAASYFRPYIGARGFIKGDLRYIVQPASIPPTSWLNNRAYWHGSVRLESSAQTASANKR